MYSKGIMFVFLLIVSIVAIIALLFVTELKPPTSTLSLFELERRASHDHRYAQELMREQLRMDIMSWLRIKDILFLFIITFLLILTFGWLWGIIIALLVIGFHGAIARLTFRGISQAAYIKLEPELLVIIGKFPWAFRLIRSSVDVSLPRLSSREELVHLIADSGEVLSADERHLITSSMTLSERKVTSIMTPKKDIVSVKKTEFLGPLMLDELHKTGHSRLLVITASLDHVVGVLHLKNLLELEDKRSVTAEKAMDSRVTTVTSDHTIEQALKTMTRAHQHLLVVTNNAGETVGLVTLNDILKTLFGPKFDDEPED
jgi:putative hemolysin